MPVPSQALPLPPRIDEGDAESLEVAHVARGESRLAGACDAGDLNVADLDGASCALPCGCDRTGSVDGCTVKELEDAAGQIPGQQLVELLLQGAAAPAVRRQLEAQPHLVLVSAPTSPKNPCRGPSVKT